MIYAIGDTKWRDIFCNTAIQCDKCYNVLRAFGIVLGEELHSFCIKDIG